MEDDPGEDEMDDVNLDGDRERHWRMVFDDNDVGVDGAKSLLHAERWDVYVNEKGNLVQGGSLVEVSLHDRKKVIWGVVDDYVV